MKYDLDEIFNSLKQKYWWILCILCIPAGFYNVENAKALNPFIEVIIKGTPYLPQTMNYNWGLLLLVYLCMFISVGYLVNYIKNCAEDIYYEQKEPDFVLYLITGLKLIPFSIFANIIALLINFLPGIILGFTAAFFPFIDIPLKIIAIIILSLMHQED